jgi:hypothetical protein
MPCPAPDASFWEEVYGVCGGEALPLCPALERWLGQMLNYCEPLG